MAIGRTSSSITSTSFYRYYLFRRPFFGTTSAFVFLPVTYQEPITLSLCLTVINNNSNRNPKHLGFCLRVTVCSYYYYNYYGKKGTVKKLSDFLKNQRHVPKIFLTVREVLRSTNCLLPGTLYQNQVASQSVLFFHYLLSWID